MHKLEAGIDSGETLSRTASGVLFISSECIRSTSVIPEEHQDMAVVKFRVDEIRPGHSERNLQWMGQGHPKTTTVLASSRRNHGRRSAHKEFEKEIGRAVAPNKGSEVVRRWVASNRRVAQYCAS